MSANAHPVRQKPGPKTRFTDEEFIRAWRMCETQEQLARRLGMKPKAVSARARSLRERGYDLPKMSVSP